MPKSEKRWGGARPGSGAKAKPARERRRNRVMLNLTDEELWALRAAAGKGSLSDYARSVLLRALGRSRS